MKEDVVRSAAPRARATRHRVPATAHRFWHNSLVVFYVSRFLLQVAQARPARTQRAAQLLDPPVGGRAAGFVPNPKDVT